jgi:hypothetical protein
MAEDKEQELIDEGVAPEIIKEELVETKPVDESPVPPAPMFTQHTFKNMPGVALIVPDQTPPAELIRIAATVVEEISLMVLRKTMAALLE